MKKHPYVYSSGPAQSTVSFSAQPPGGAPHLALLDIQLPGVNSVEKLTRREQEVLELLSRGFLYKEICHHLGIALPTVKSHLKQIYGKLRVQTRTEAAVRFLTAR